MPTTERGKPVLAEHQRRFRRRRWLSWVVLVAFVAAVVTAGYAAFRAVFPDMLGQQCTATAFGQSTDLTPEQAANAATIAALSVKRGLPPRAATIAIATAMQESKLRNLRVGDRDSIGLFQQRPSQGWGTEAQILDPVYSTNAFYDALVKIPDYQNRPVTEVAQAVQRSAYPTAYAQHEDEARILASVLTGYSPAGMVCRLGQPGQPGDPDAVAAALGAQLGVSTDVTGDTVSTDAEDQLGWAAGAWAVANAQARAVTAVQVADREWNRSEPADWGQATPATPVEVTVADAR